VPGASPASYRPQPSGAAVRSSYHAPAGSSSTYPVVVAVIVLVVLAILALLVNAAFKRLIPVTPSGMGIQTSSAVTWTPVPEFSSTFHYVDFRIQTTNSSDEERKVKYCARKFADAPDVCVTYKVSPRSTKEVIERRALQLERDNDVLDGPTKRVVRIDGRHVTD
jgi:hypothetical protein